jgi:hypothetical protein
VVRLRWQVDQAGYDLMSMGDFHRRQHEAESRRRPPDRKGTILEGEGPDDDELALVPRGGRAQSYDVALGESPLYLEIVRSGKADVALVAAEFTARWGLLTAGPYTLLSDFARMRQRLRSLLDGKRSFKSLAQDNEGLRLGFADITISKTGAEKMPEVNLYVRHLQSFCWLEYLTDAGGAVSIRRCQRCSAYFRRQHVPGPAGTYCSNACKQAAWRERNPRGPKRVTSR